MGAEDQAEPAGSRRWAAFLKCTAHDDNKARYIDDFHEIFTAALASRDITEKLYLDKSETTKYGDVRKHFRERASTADFLIIFVGNQYPKREFCLFEWDAFRSQFSDWEQAKARLCIVEIEKTLSLSLLKTQTRLNLNANVHQDLLPVFMKNA